jgi:hypothetical protein
MRDRHQVHALPDVLRGAVELVEQGGARRAGAFRQREERGPAGLGPWALVAGRAREHEVVDDERILAGREQLRKPHVGWVAVRSGPLEDVVLRHGPARGEPAPGGGYRLGGAAQLDLLLEQPVARRPVVR